MTLFFEAEQQGAVFLLLCAMGFALALALDIIQRMSRGRMKPLGDILLFLGTGLLMLWALFFSREGQVRAYHWLALLCGCILYACGVRRWFAFFSQKWKNVLETRKKEKKL